LFAKAQVEVAEEVVAVPRLLERTLVVEPVVVVPELNVHSQLLCFPPEPSRSPWQPQEVQVEQVVLAPVPTVQPGLLEQTQRSTRW
jgi:hypothetical protein